MIIKLIYTARFMLYPSIKSEISIIAIGIKKESFLLVKKAPPNSATAPTAVKLGGCGIIRVKTPNMINPVIIKLYLFNIFLSLFKCIKKYLHKILLAIFTL